MCCFSLVVPRYVTDNPGAWMFHCHLQWHIVVRLPYPAPQLISSLLK